MESNTLAALEALCEAQRSYERADEARDQAVAAARAAGATWEHVAYATRTSQSTAHRRWMPGRVPVYGVPVPIDRPRDKRRGKGVPEALRAVAS